MARPTKKEKFRKDTKNAILNALQSKKTVEKYLLDQVDEYMEYFDSLATINERLSKGFDVELSREKRQVTKEMRNILIFLGLKPTEAGMLGSDMDEEL